MLVLKTLAPEPMHGDGVAVGIEQVRKGVFRVQAGSMCSLPSFRGYNEPD